MVRNWKESYQFFQNLFFFKESIHGHVECSFDTSHETFWPQALKMALSQKFLEKTRILRKIFFFKTILRAHWKQFWQTPVFAKSLRMTEQVHKHRKKFL